MANTVEVIFDANNQTDKAFAQLLSDVKRTADGVEKMGTKGTKALDDLDKKATKTSKSFGRSISVMAGKFLVLELAITHVGRLLDDLVFDFNSTLETAQLGIASAFMTGGEYVDITTGKVLEGSEALKAAQEDATSATKKLQAANLQTIATLDQLVRAYQETLPVAMAKGFDRTQIEDFTVAMVQAAGAIGLSLDMLGEETRSMLTGAINPRTSRIATVLGLRNEDIAKYKNDADGLFSFLMDKLSAYREAGIESQKTWAGVWSNAVDIFKQLSAETSKPLFEQIKKDLGEINSQFVSINEITGELEIDKKFEGASKLLSSIYATLKGTLDVLKAHYELLADVGVIDTAAWSFEKLAESARNYANAIRLTGEYLSGNVGFFDWMAASPADSAKLLADLDKQDRALLSLQNRVKELKAHKSGNFWWSAYEENELQQAIKAVSDYNERLKDVAALKNAAQHIAAKPFDLLAYRQRETEKEDPTLNSSTYAPPTDDQWLIKVREEIETSKKALEVLQEYNREKYAADIFAGEQLGDDNWLAFEEGKLEAQERTLTQAIELHATWQDSIQNGLDELADYYEETFSDRVAGTINSAFDSMEDALVQFAMTGKANFSDMVTSILSDIARLTIQQNITGPLATALSTGLGNLFPSADGNIFSHGRIVPFASGTVLTKPTFFPMADGNTGLAGEAGEEGILPLKRIGGQLGVLADFGGGSGGGISSVTINNYRNPEDVSTQQQSNGRGGMDLIVTIEKTMAAGIRSKGSPLSQALEQIYGLRRGGF